MNVNILVFMFESVDGHVLLASNHRIASQHRCLVVIFLFLSHQP